MQIHGIEKLMLFSNNSVEFGVLGELFLCSILKQSCKQAGGEGHR